MIERPAIPLASMALAAALTAAWAVSPALAQQQLQARAAVEMEEVFAGQPFRFVIQVEGSDSPEKPRLIGFDDFRVREAGGSKNNSQSISIINGRVTQQVTRGYAFNYQLTPKREGELTVPAVEVRAGGETAWTKPLRVRALPPSESDDFRLSMRLSQSKAYVGQPLTLEVTWYIGKNVDNYSFTMPLLEDERFSLVSLDPPRSADQVPLFVGDAQVFAEKGRARLEDWNYVAVTFRKVLVPLRAGSFRLPETTVSFRAIERYQQSRRRSLLDDFFGGSVFDDPFFSRRRPVYRTYVIPSNSPRLEVLPLPRQGRPASFSGLVGEYSIEAEAEPTEVSVGEPITLTMRVRGPDYLGNVKMPPLEASPGLTEDFQIPQDAGPGEIDGGAKIFRQTLRARHNGVSQIPSIELSYFDPRTAGYVTARTEPIPLKVHATRVVTARDAEGGALPGERPAAEPVIEGIAANYDDLSALEDQSFPAAAWLLSPLGLLLVFGPPLAYAAMAGGAVLLRRREANPEARRAQRAFAEFSEWLAKTPQPAEEQLQRRLRQYLGSRLNRNPAALTYPDVAPGLREAGAPEPLLAELEALFSTLEAGRYGAGMTEADARSLADRTARTVQALEEVLK